MKFRRIFSIFLIILIALLLLQSESWNDKMGQVEPFRGAKLEKSVFAPLISKNLNKLSVVKLQVDNKTYDSENGEILLNSNLEVLASFTLIRNIFYANARLYNDSDIVIQRNNDDFKFKIGSVKGLKNNKEVNITVPPEKVGNKVYMSLKDICKIFSYKYDWNDTKKVVSLKSEGSEKPVLRAFYDLRKEGRASKIKNQGKLSTCWAFAATSAIESLLLPSEKVSFSALDMANRNTYKRKADSPGDYMMAVSYLLSWTGPIANGGGEPVKHLQEVHFYNNSEMDDIKWAIFKNGGVSTSLYAETGGEIFEKSDYYNRDTDAYYYYGKKKSNHDIVIIGWDDNYPASKFSHKCPGNGAFICQNSWGDNFGDNGVFYVSYYDTNIGNYSVSYVKLESNKNYDNIYQSDLCGDIGSVGYGMDTAMAANVYRMRTDEVVKAVGFYNLNRNTDYEVYIVSNFKNVKSFAEKTLVASGTLKEKGYFTIPINPTVDTKEGEDVAVIVSFKSKKKKNQIAIEYDGNSLTHNVDISDGEGYISPDGNDWERIENKFDANVCLKVYTDEKKK